ncbi:MAG: hypothetical protein L7F78_27345, partial [Syntrophales bacterium LBB04]|nr:hypothetical protein [Syntrophales bacterium LBB04]
MARIRMNPILLLFKQRIQSIPRRARGPGGAPRPALPEAEIFAEVRPVFFQDPIRLRFPALVVRGGLMVCTIQAAAQLRPAVRTIGLSPDGIGRENLRSAGVAAFHPLSPPSTSPSL